MRGRLRRLEATGKELKGNTHPLNAYAAATVRSNWERIERAVVSAGTHSCDVEATGKELKAGRWGDAGGALAGAGSNWERIERQFYGKRLDVNKLLQEATGKELKASARTPSLTRVVLDFIY